MDYTEFLTLLRALRNEGVEYLLIGGAAVNVHGIVRMTEDVDLFVRRSNASATSTRPAALSGWPAVTRSSASASAGCGPSASA
jgi:hypothetical protein